MEQKLKQDIQIGETIRSLRMERKLTQDQVVSKLQLMDLDITRSILLSDRRRYLQHPHLGPCRPGPDLSGGL